MRNGMKKSTFRELLQTPDKKKGEAKNELAVLFRDMLLTHGILPSEWDRKVERYYTKIFTNAAGEVDMLKVNQEKSNLTRALTKDSIPWKRFITGVAVLGPASFRLGIELNYATGHTYKHQVLKKMRYTAPVEVHEEEDDEESDDE